MAEFTLIKSNDYQLLNDTNGAMLAPSGKWMLQNLSSISTIEFIIADAVPARDQRGFRLRARKLSFFGQLSGGANWYYRIIGSMPSAKLRSEAYTGSIADPGNVDTPIPDSTQKFVKAHAVYNSPGAKVEFMPARDMRVLVNYSATGWRDVVGRGRWYFDNSGAAIVAEPVSRLELYFDATYFHLSLMPVTAVYDVTEGVLARFKMGTHSSLKVDNVDLSSIIVMEL